jgi:ribosomal protein L21E
MTTSTSPLPAGEYRVTGEPVWGSSENESQHPLGAVVQLESTRHPDMDGDVFVHAGSTSGYIRASSLSPAHLFTEGQRVRVANFASTAYPDDAVTQTGYVAPSAFGKTGKVSGTSGNGNIIVKGDDFYQYIHPAYLTLINDEPTLAERFPVGRKVLVGAAPKVADGGWVDEAFAGEVGEVAGHVNGWGGNVTVRVAGRTNHIGPDHLTLLPENVEVAPVTVREPLTFAAAYAKATNHLGTPESADDVAKASRLAELLIEVSA